ncbi:uncharacterized protein LOC124932413 [Impatiens glandulifera]|uniref:uncharacterized protein LOC124932413 n=1 Tax=Impatiens glandulifera TaxID=253017 RepID=UPI001FB0CA84|nr:uncharacterized protein LOC124932413 [Impatiens glandulifera]
MECNKDEAVRAQKIAEKKLMEKDFVGSKKFALKAQALNPALEIVSHILMTLDVHMAGEKKVRGEVDWYGILGVTHMADEDTMRNRYKKLAIMLHPDKNRSIGAEGAFKLISQAWSILSDKSKRLAYNKRRGLGMCIPKVPSPVANGTHSFPAAASATAATNVKTQDVGNGKRDTFWTTCNRCKMHYEYVRAYVNKVLRCPSCRKTFVATETNPPVNLSKPLNPSSLGPQSNQATAARSQHSDLRKPGGLNSEHMMFKQGGSTYNRPVVGTQATNVVQQTNMLKRKEIHGWDRGSAAYGTSSCKKAKGLEEHKAAEVHGHGVNMQAPTGGSFRSISRSWMNNDQAASFSKPSNRLKELTPIQTKKMLLGKAQLDIRRKVEELKSKSINEKLKENKKVREETTTVKVDSDSKRKEPSMDSDEVVIMPNVQSIVVPDPDFHNFDEDRSETSFGESEVWAAYDDTDGMPRFYALIHKVISVKPFKVRLSWLNSKSNVEFGPMKWVACGYTKTCGEFWVGKHEVNKTLNSFSHKVKWEKSARGSISIFPRKGEVWALYRNWSPDWNEHTPDDLVQKYDMVKVVDEEEGIQVRPLVKAVGFKTVFHQDRDPGKLMRIPKEEMFRFSHQVPSYLLTGAEGKEGGGAPLMGYDELDPAATPLELLQVLTEEAAGGEGIHDKFLPGRSLRKSTYARNSGRSHERSKQYCSHYNIEGHGIYACCTKNISRLIQRTERSRNKAFKHETKVVETPLDFC